MARQDHRMYGNRLLQRARRYQSDLDRVIHEVDERMSQYMIDFPPVGRSRFDDFHYWYNEGKKVVPNAARLLSLGDSYSVDMAIESLENYNDEMSNLDLSRALNEMNRKYPPRPDFGSRGGGGKDSARYGFGAGMTPADARRNPRSMLSPDLRKVALTYLNEARRALKAGDEAGASYAAGKAARLLLHYTGSDDKPSGF